MEKMVLYLVTTSLGILHYSDYKEQLYFSKHYKKQKDKKKRVSYQKHFFSCLKNNYINLFFYRNKSITVLLLLKVFYSFEVQLTVNSSLGLHEGKMTHTQSD